MKNYAIFSIGALGVFALLLTVGYKVLDNNTTPNDARLAAGVSLALNMMELRSPDITNTDELQSQFTCDGEEVSPAFVFGDVPQEAQSLALIGQSDDAATTQLVVWDIPTQTMNIDSGELIPGTYGVNSNGINDYSGPCGEAGVTHEYQFTLYALDMLVGLPAGSSVEQLMAAMDRHIVAKSILKTKYTRE